MLRTAHPMPCGRIRSGRLPTPEAHRLACISPCRRNTRPRGDPRSPFIPTLLGTRDHSSSAPRSQYLGGCYTSVGKLYGGKVVELEGGSVRTVLRRSDQS